MSGFRFPIFDFALYVQVAPLFSVVVQELKIKSWWVFFGGNTEEDLTVPSTFLMHDAMGEEKPELFCNCI